MGAWMAMVTTSGALARATSPALLGPMYDTNDRYPFLITASSCILSIGCALALGRVPDLRPKATPEPAEATLTQEGDGLQSVDEPTLSSEDLAAAQSRRLTGDDVRPSSSDVELEVEDLEVAYARLLKVKQSIENGENVPEPDQGEGPTDEDTQDLGRWMAAMLQRQGYIHWWQHKSAIRALALNAFPKIRDQPRIARLSDLLGMLGAHFELERTWAGHKLSHQEHFAEIGSIYK